MPLRQTPHLHVPYVLLAYGSAGTERTDDPDGINGVLSAQVLRQIQAQPPTDIFIQCHGWLGDMPGSIALYDAWIDSMSALSNDVAAMGAGFSPLWIGLHWPSKPWGEEEMPSAATSFALGTDDYDSQQARWLEAYLERLNLRDSLQARQSLGVVFRAHRMAPFVPVLPPEAEAAYRALAELLKFETKGIGFAPSADNASFDPNQALQAMNAGGSPSSFGAGGWLLNPLRVLSFWSMKRRARTVGEGGMYDFLAGIQSIAPNTRIHIAGHSFGCIVAASMIGGMDGKKFSRRPVDSLALLQAAVSLWSFSDNIPATNGVGYYNSMLRRPGVSGPMITTQSEFDRATGVWYPAAVGLVLTDPSFAATTAGAVGPPALWGAIGTWGAQGARASHLKMGPPNSEYGFAPGKLYNLESSEFIRTGGGFEGAHGDILGPEVSHAVWQAARPPAVQNFATTAVRLGVSTPKLAGLAEIDMPIPFGVQAETGEYLPGIRPEDLSHIDAFSNAARTRGDDRRASNLSTMVEVDPNDLSAAGWGVLLPAQMDAARKAAIQTALEPLLDLRKGQAGKLFRVFDGAAGYQVNQTAEGWLQDRGSGFFPVNPAQGVPYYLLLIGSPDDIPFSFQYDLDMYFAVGRLFFDTPGEYAVYANHMVSFENGSTSQTRHMAIFNPRNEGDAATGLLHDQVAWPLVHGGDGLLPLGAAQGFSLTSLLAGNATKKELLDLLAGKKGVPTVLFTGSHGVAFSTSDLEQTKKQGAILTQNWGGPFSPVSPDTYLTAAEIPQETNLAGLIHFFFACFSGGCPDFDTYSYGPNDQPVKIANQTFVARLPQKFLLQGAQAVISHIDRAWVYSFQTQAGQPMVQVFRDPLVRLLQQNRVGHAVDVFDQRWTVLSSQLLTMMQMRKGNPQSVSDAALANRWVARDDARNYVVLGDPAARLRLGPASTAINRPSFALRSMVSFPAAAPEALEAPVVSLETFPVHSEARPKLVFRDFSGALDLTAAVSPDCSYQLVAAAIAEAGNGSHLDAYIYSISAPYLIGLLTGAQQRGAQIRVMYDPDQMKASDAQTLKNLGFDVKIAPSHDPRRVFTVCHQKFFVIDRRIVVLGSANWAKTSIPEREANQARKIGNREWLVRMDDDAIASWYQDLFDADWNIPDLPAALGIVEPTLLVPLAFRAPRLNPPRDFAVTLFRKQQMTVTPLTSPDDYFSQVLPLIQGAQQRVWIQQQYIEGAGGPSVPQLLDAIAKRLRDRAVDVRIVISSRFPKNWEASKATLKDAGLIDRLKAINLENFVHCHNKGVVVDSSAVVSSTNWSENSIRSAREAGLLIHSPAVTDFYSGVFEDDWNTGWTVEVADGKGSSFAVGGAVPPGESVEIEPCDQV